MTERLTLRRWTETHFHHLYELASRPEVVKHVGDGRPWDRGTAESKHRAALAHWDRRNFGWLAIHDATGEFVGLVAMTAQEDEPRTVEIGYWIVPEAWGRGYATEAVTAAIDAAFHNGHAERVTARYQEGNRASERLLEKLGFVTRQAGDTMRTAMLEVSWYEPLRPAPRK